ncbi:MAG TPA: carbon storage regulator [Pirellulaceae bacterium]|nr:carbon storage regulator [Pirellulaceae bacterium]
MLVLSRKVGERVLIGDRIAITIVRINGNAVRLGIEAPADMVVVRQELAERTAEGEATATEATSPLPLGEG